MTRDDRTIILIGYRGTGKTSVGRELARRLNRPFYDTDVLVEAREGRSIRDMVEQEGWTYFREREKAALRSLRTMHRCVVATGGGAVLDPDNARLLISMGWIVLLTAREGILVRRILQDPASLEKRPSFSGTESAEQSMESMIEETKEILAQRMPIYRSLADLVIDTANVSPGEVADRILRHFSFGE
ncbi:MAG: Shikimate kinase 2 [Syntrophus sp. PtaU1.Bin005]|nr:MAG: Shikimate kinase 2 [Syntrophus sp. PtaU1.Bin005]